jgi:PBP1b-binding outer membrane lipoprotein LpoB
MTKRQLFCLLLAGLMLLTGCVSASDDGGEQPSITPGPTEDSPELEPFQAVLDSLIALLTDAGA